MNYHVVSHPEVEQDIFDIVDYIAPFAGLASARKATDDITGFITRLGDFPKIGSLRNDVRPGLRAVAVREAAICFVVDDETATVTILGVGFAGSDWTRRVRDRG
ncbi:type II toxin-antitoxin system RelE/ParE family toxin [Rhizobium sp. CSW-27]|uniref:type II toxin-antitoxin system RelE/ParE family toxin n=1 Tax=Rhizobium sp. CSW-27 TaxID=2839985 RepID=UPI001C01439A|nr:type II toxin-antitoxin system RelE/ParE family toxin [Rhizobium sp. CSW-27]MBT9368876.1 type II toxin-antitoxin system RelE/ParE family toxin [Rhizobium sp. CSW-27]